MKKTLFLLTLCSLLLAASCNSDDDATPDTSNDHRIVRCKVNGEDWIPLNDGSGGIFSPTGPPYDLQYYSDTKRMGLDAFISTTEVRQSIDVSCVLDKTNEKLPIRYKGEEFINWNLEYPCLYYNLDSLSTNYIEVISVDTVNYVISGNFEFIAINPCNNDTVKVTDGYFDLHYRF